jgi:2-polyprenyl-3-methyl-5-hydroxy-6-metoxy-1,4-benzoquinol methylase
VAADRPEQLATAHLEWDRRWQAPEQQASRWHTPEPFLLALVPLFKARGYRRVLDLGCGIGRHAQHLAAEGFSCVGIDASEAGLAYARQRAAEAGLSIDYRGGPFYSVPFGAASFEVVIAWNVIYHGDGELAQQAIDEIRRLLAPGGIYVGSMLSKRNVRYGQGREVRPDTFVVDEATGDERHPHFYCDGARLIELHRGFEVLELRDREQAPGAWHWEFCFERVRDG